MYHIKTDKNEVSEIRKVDKLIEGPYSYMELLDVYKDKLILYPGRSSKYVVGRFICGDCNKELFEHTAFSEVKSVYTSTYGLSCTEITRKLGYIILDDNAHLYVNKHNNFVCKECYNRCECK